MKIPRDLTLVLAKLDIPGMVENAQVNCFGIAVLLKIKAHSLAWESRRLFPGFVSRTRVVHKSSTL